MLKQAAELFALLTSSLISIAVVFYKIPSSLIQQSIAVLVVILLVVIQRFVFARKKPVPFAIVLLLVFLISTFLQLLVLSSGGFYSPFLILFHLFTIATSFLIKVRIAIGFLCFSIVALFINTFLDNKLYSLISNDPWSAALYILSFIVIIPLYQFISNTYHLEKAISKILSSELKSTTSKLQQTGDQLELTKKKDELILGGLSDLVIVTDLNLKVLSVNGTAVKALELTDTPPLSQPIFSLFYLKDMRGQVIDKQFLSIDEIIRLGTTHLFNDLLLYTKNITIPKKINLRIHPTKNLNGQIDQIVFIISNFYGGGHSTATYQDIDQAVLRNKTLLESIKNRLNGQNLKDLNVDITVLGKTEEDILTAIQIANHGIKPNLSLIDAADLLQRVITNESSFAQNLGIMLDFSLSDEFIEKFATLDIQKNQAIPLAFTSQYFTVLTEPRWLEFLVKKILDLLILVSTKEGQPKIEIMMSYDKERVNLDFICNPVLPVVSDFTQTILTKQYNNGSGLEGYLIKTITTLINIPLDIKYNDNSKLLNFNVKLPKNPMR